MYRCCHITALSCFTSHVVVNLNGSNFLVRDLSHLLVAERCLMGLICYCRNAASVCVHMKMDPNCGNYLVATISTALASTSGCSSMRSAPSASTIYWSPKAGRKYSHRNTWWLPVIYMISGGRLGVHNKKVIRTSAVGCTSILCNMSLTRNICCSAGCRVRMARAI